MHCQSLEDGQLASADSPLSLFSFLLPYLCMFQFWPHICIQLHVYLYNGSGTGDFLACGILMESCTVEDPVSVAGSPLVHTTCCLGYILNHWNCHGSTVLYSISSYSGSRRVTRVTAGEVTVTGT